MDEREKLVAELAEAKTAASAYRTAWSQTADRAAALGKMLADERSAASYHRHWTDELIRKLLKQAADLRKKLKRAKAAR